MKRILVILLLILFVGGFVFNSFFSGNGTSDLPQKNIKPTEETQDQWNISFPKSSRQTRFTVQFPQNIPADSILLICNMERRLFNDKSIELNAYKSGLNEAKIFWFYQGEENSFVYRWEQLASKPAQTVSAQLIKELKHDERNYTQGYEFLDGKILESTGQNGDSRMVYGPMGGAGSDQYQLGATYFGEGLTVFKDKIYLVTWKNREGFIFDKEFNKINNFYYDTEGWGLSHNDTAIILSDGSHQLYFKDEINFNNKAVLEVYDDKGRVSDLNELEVVGHYVLANRYGYEEVVIIDLRTGYVTAKMDLSFLKERLNTDKRIDVLNGIAYNKNNGHLYFTGKLWPKTFEMKVNFDFNN